jgi:D-alanyl-D-alanine carboxypeptidase
VTIKPSEALRFLGAVAAVVVLGGLLVLRVTSCAPLPRPAARAPVQPMASAGAPHSAPVAAAGCAPVGWDAAAGANAASLRTLAWAPFGRQETGWETYAPMIGQEIGSPCAPDTPGFAAALAAWQASHGQGADGVLTDQGFAALKTQVQLRRPFVQFGARRVCPAPAVESALETGRPGEGYGGKIVQLRPGAFEAWRRMAAAARAEDPTVRADPRNLTIFSAYRSPNADAARCATQGNCDGIVRANCSPHRTGLAMDLYVGQAPGYPPDSTADPNRLAMTHGPAYRWLLANAGRFGFVNYPFEPWHWEWTGEAP